MTITEAKAIGNADGFFPASSYHDCKVGMFAVLVVCFNMAQSHAKAVCEVAITDFINATKASGGQRTAKAGATKKGGKIDLSDAAKDKN